MNEKKFNDMRKISRQLIILHIFLYSKIVEITEITKLIRVSNKTIIRDLRELQDAGLLNIEYSKKERGYVHIDDKKRCPFFSPIPSDNRAKNAHLNRLIRIASIMIDLRNHVELPFYDDDSKDQETCSTWYNKKFPTLSKRTMQRDFEELNKIGYEIQYCPYDKYYIVDFPEGLGGIESRLETLF